MYRFSTILFLSLLLAACAAKMATPRSAADAFWSACRAGKPDVARRYAQGATKEMPLLSRLKITRVSFAHPTRSDQKATVPTRLFVRNGLSPAHKELEVDFTTYLVRDAKGVWKVDLDATRADLYPKLAARFSQTMQEDVRSLFKTGFGTLKKVLEQLVQGMQKGVNR